MDLRPRVAVLGAALVVVSYLCAAWSASGFESTSSDEPWPLANHFFVPPIAFSADGRYLALGGSVGPAVDDCRPPRCQGRLHVWDLRTGQRVLASDSKFARVMSLAFARDGGFIVTGHADGSVVVWNTRTFAVARRFTCCSGTWIRALALSPDEKTLAIGAQSGELVLWDIAEGLTDRAVASSVSVSRTLAGHLFGVSSLTFDAAGQYLLSSADDQHVRRWNLKTGGNYEFSRSPGHAKAHRGMVKTVVTLKHGRQALSGAYWEGGTVKDYRSVAPPDHILRLWDVDTGTALRSYPLTYGIRCCIQVLNDRVVAFLKATGWDERPVLQVFNLETATVEHEFTGIAGESLHAMAMHPNTKQFLIAVGDGQYLVWNIRTGTVSAQIISADEGWAVFLANGMADFSDGFKRWPCRRNITQACLGGKDVSATKGLLGRVFEER